VSDIHRVSKGSKVWGRDFKNSLGSEKKENMFHDPFFSDLEEGAVKEQRLNFGPMRVGQTVDKTFNVVNKGKYPVIYEVKCRRKQLNQLLSFEDGCQEGTLEPGEKKPVKISASSNKEVRIHDAPDLLLLIKEAKPPQEKMEPEVPPIKVSVHAENNQFSVTPPRGVSFGPVKKGDSRNRVFEIKNDGIFGFEWFLFDLANPPPPAEDGGKPAPVTTGALQIGPFTVSPAVGNCEPGKSAEVSVKFDATDNQEHDSKIGIFVDGVENSVELAESAPRTTAPARVMGCPLLRWPICCPGRVASRASMLTTSSLSSRSNS
jgi:hypothetical protein